MDQETGKTEALGMPSGSVRAIILLGLTAAIVVPVFVFMFRQTDVPTGIGNFLTTLLVGLVGLIKDYIQERKETAAGQAAVDLAGKEKV